MPVRIWVFFHLLGMALWLGGMFALSMWTSRSRKADDLRVVAFAYSVAHRLYRGIVLGAAWLSVLSGVVLMFVTDRPWFRPFPEHWLFQMQILGIIAVLAFTFYVVPNAGALAMLAGQAAVEGEPSAAFNARVKKQAIVGSVIGAILVYQVLLGSLRF